MSLTDDRGSRSYSQTDPARSIDRSPAQPYSGAMLCMKQISRSVAVIAWVTLAASLVITGDLVIDLAFEEAEIQTSADASAGPEEPDNAAEHILMPSQKADNLATSRQFVMAAPLQVELISNSAPPLLIRRANPIHERPPRSSPVPLPLPLRI